MKISIQGKKCEKNEQKNKKTIIEKLWDWRKQEGKEGEKHLSSYTAAIHASQLLCTILKWKLQKTNWEGKQIVWLSRVIVSP